MRRVKIVVATVALALAGKAMSDAHKPLDAMQPYEMYVVADVLPNGEVAAVHTYERLSPQLTNLQRSTVASWVTGPTIVNGRRSYYRVLFHVALETDRVTQGQYSASFAYLSAEPLRARSDALRARFSPGKNFYSPPGTLIGIAPPRP
ncbi:hypothetical protein [Dyella sp.]|uniref:hypothetical protein n=1 Tax=Dyella sp. TaxID=1869338 RepID=UPI003F806EFC